MTTYWTVTHWIFKNSPSTVPQGYWKGGRVTKLFLTEKHQQKQRRKNIIGKSPLSKPQCNNWYTQEQNICMVSKLHPMDYVLNAKGMGTLAVRNRADMTLTKSSNWASPGVKPIGIRCFVWSLGSNNTTEVVSLPQRQWESTNHEETIRQIEIVGQSIEQLASTLQIYLRFKRSPSPKRRGDFSLF